MEWLLRRNWWWVKLTTTIVLAAFAANTATTIAAMWLYRSISDIAGPVDDDATESEEVEIEVDNPWKRDPEKVAARILGRDVFCPTCLPPGEEGPGVPPALRPDGTVDLSGAQRSALPLLLSATMEAEDPHASLATIKLTDRGIAGLFGVGDELMPGVTVVAIAGGRIDIVNAGVAEYVTTGPAPAMPAKPQVRTTATTAKPAPSANQIPGAEEAIKCQGESCQVERRFVEDLIASPAQLVGQGRAAPAKTKDGEDGYRIAGVRSGSLPHLLGLKNGDIITEVGGKPLTIDEMMKLTQQLKSARHIEVTIDRRGAKMTKALELV